MNQGLFFAQINDTWKIARNLHIEGDREWDPTYPTNPGALFRSLTYLEAWTLSFQDHYYDFSLYDNSLIQFVAHSFNAFSASYSYLECPYDCLPYHEFVELELGLDILEVRDSFASDYTEYIVTCGIKETVTPLRYDYAPANYTEGSHPASHFHLGYASEIRIGAHRILRPISFMLFVLRQCYPKSWRRLHALNDSAVWCRNVRDNIETIDDSLLGDLDDRELMLM